MRYRSEKVGVGGNGIRDILAVMTYEIYNMGNSDILTTLIPTIKPVNPELSCEMQSMVNELEENFSFDDMGEDDVHEICQKIVECLNNIYHKNLKYCLWLADYNVVMNYYGHGRLSLSDIDGYMESDIVLSKIEPDGSLYAYEENPVKIVDGNDYLRLCAV